MKKLKEILEECKKRYPVGTTYRCAGDFDYIYVVQEQSFAIRTKYGDQIHGEHGKGILWENGKFAEIIYTPKIENMITITREQLKEIHDIACYDWKKKIEIIASNQPFGDIELSNTQVKEMRNAATSTQKPTIEKIFGKEITQKCFPKLNEFRRKNHETVSLFSSDVSNLKAILTPSVMEDNKELLFIHSKFKVSVEESNGHSYLKIEEK